MKKQKQPKDKQVLLYLDRMTKADYSHDAIQTFAFTFVTMSAEGVRNPSYEYEAWNNLTFRCQANGNDLEPYGEELYYQNVHSVELRDAERMYKMLKRAAQVAAHFPIRPRSFGQYVQLMCQGLKVDGCVSESGNQQTRDNRPSSYDERLHNTWKLTDIAWLVDTKVKEFFDEHGERMKAAHASRW